MMYLNEIRISNSVDKLEDKKIKADFIAIKASEGCKTENYNFDSEAQKVLDNNKKLIVYHSIDEKTSGAEEAFYFWKIVYKYNKKAIFVVNWNGDDISYVKAFLDNFYKVSNERCIVSTNKEINNELWNEIEKNYKIWVREDQNIFEKKYFYGEEKISEIKKESIKKQEKDSVDAPIKTTFKENNVKTQTTKGKKTNQYKKTSKK